MLPSMKIVPRSFKIFVDWSHEISPRIVLPAFDWHVYEVGGVRLIALTGVALQLIELSGAPLAVSKTGGVPVEVVHGANGPRSAFWYQKPMLLVVPGSAGGKIAPPYGAQHV